MAKYRVKRPFSHGKHYRPGDVININNKQHARQMKEKGLLYPNYETKEDKNAYSRQVKAYKKHLGGGWYEVRRAGELIEKVQGQQNAEAKVKELNGDT